MPRDRSTEIRLETDVRAIAEPGDRVAGNARWRATRDWLSGRLFELDLDTYAGARDYALPYRVGDIELANLVGVVPGERLGADPLLIGAHFDTVPGTPGADDNAAAVAITLEVARRLADAPVQRDVLIAFFAAEEPPFFHTAAMGSTVFYEHQRKGPVHAALVLDLVGHSVPAPTLGDLLFITGMETDPDLERTLTGLKLPDSVRIVTALNRYVGDMSDHHAFRLGKTPYLFLTCGRWWHYHQPSDTPDKLDYRKMAGIADLLERIVRDVAGRELTGPWEGYDTTPTDLAFMKRAMGVQLRLFGMKLESREDIDKVAERLLSLGL